MKRLNENTFIEWIKTAFDIGDLVLLEDDLDRCFGPEDETLHIGPFFNSFGVWIDRGTDERTHDEKLLLRYSNVNKYYIEPRTEWAPYQIYLIFTEENIDEIQKNAEQEMEQTAKISLKDFLSDVIK